MKHVLLRSTIDSNLNNRLYYNIKLKIQKKKLAQAYFERPYFSKFFGGKMKKILNRYYHRKLSQNWHELSYVNLRSFLFTIYSKEWRFEQEKMREWRNQME